MRVAAGRARARGARRAPGPPNALPRPPRALSLTRARPLPRHHRVVVAVSKEMWVKVSYGVGARGARARAPRENPPPPHRVSSPSLPRAQVTFGMIVFLVAPYTAFTVYKEAVHEHSTYVQYPHMKVRPSGYDRGDSGLAASPSRARGAAGASTRCRRETAEACAAAVALAATALRRWGPRRPPPLLRSLPAGVASARRAALCRSSLSSAPSAFSLSSRRCSHRVPPPHTPRRL